MKNWLHTSLLKAQVEAANSSKEGSETHVAVARHLLLIRSGHMQNAIRHVNAKGWE